MKSSINAFAKGLVTDIHPLMTTSDHLTDALNASFITYNGNEYILQNDMGNTIIKDSNTGAIMGLKDGFIPIGMKEHGGVLYIASFNPVTKEGELGSIPSPIFNYSFNSKPYILTYNLCSLYNLPTDDNFKLSDLVETCDYIPLSNLILSVGDFFFVGVDIDGGDDLLSSTVNMLYTSDGIQPQEKTLNFSIFLKFTLNQDESAGLFDIELFTKSEQKSTFIKIDTTNHSKVNSEYWFKLNNVDTTIDPVEYRFKKNFYSYPNIQYGQLYIKLKLRPVYSDFKFILNEDTGLNSPFYYYEI